MIITKLSGGLGNQMFQYALGRTICDINNYELFIDISGYSAKSTDTVRQFKLDSFDIRARVASDKILAPYKVGRIGSVINTITGRKLFSPKLKITYEMGHQYNKNVLNLSGNNYLLGYWQTEKYFQNNRQNILKDFVPKISISTKSHKLIDRVQNTKSVSVHVRRGDYVTSKAANSFHGTCDVNYYSRAANFILRKFKDVDFFVFSDDINWARENILNGVPNVNFVDNVLSSHIDIEEMIIMANCKHNIIANSSFSWWGAWLNININKVVLAPNKWFNDKSVNTKDILPAEWVKL